MIAVMRCSACGSEVVIGAEKCNGCGLQLAAYAVAVRQARKRPLPLWFYALCLLVIVAIVGTIESQQHKQHRAAMTLALHNGSLSSPAAFQKQCGNADSVVNTTNGQVLEYNRADLAVTFAGRDVLFAGRDQHGKFSFDWQRRSDDYAMDTLRCDGAQ